MSAAPNQLVKIYRQLTEQFSSHKAISIEPTKGDPPDRYEITYNVKGLSKPGSGDVVEITGHVVELAIPFGFPHFPPSCKPKSDIFHPDFDPAAICLGDFWHQDCSLPDLVLYIGRLINGEFYSRTNAFNEEACIWYNNHTDTFPLAEVEWREKEPAQAISEKFDNPGIDTLDEHDLSTDFDFLAIEETKEKDDLLPDEPLPATGPVSNLDLDLINLLEKQKRFYALYENLNGIDSGSLPIELHQLYRKTEEKIRKVEDLFRESQLSEKRGNARDALAALDKIAGYTEDFPDFEAHATRLRQTLADSATKDGKAGSGVPILDEQVEEGEVSAPIADKQKKHSRPAEKKIAVPTFHWNRRLIGYLFGGCIMVLISCCGYYYWIATARLGAAETALSECSSLLEKGQFENAKRSCEEALTAVNGIKYLHKERVEQQRIHLGQILQSERMSQGLKGMVLVDGKYLAIKEAELIRTFRLLHNEAETLYSEEKWQPAIERFTQMLAPAETTTIITGDIVADVRRKHAIAQFRLIFDSGMRSLQNGKWQEAITELTKAEGLLGLLPEDDIQQYLTELKNSLAKGTFEQSREQGDLFFAGSEWQKAIASYERALSVSGADALPKESFALIQRNIKRAELYDLIDQGIRAFGAGAWDEAIGEYRRAEEFLASHQAYLDVADAEKNIKKLSRIILRALIVRDRQLAAGHLEKNELPAANNIYRQLINHIDNSPFSGEGEFLENRKEFEATIQTLDEKIFVGEKSRYLENEYRPLFAANYPTAVVENLVNPIISFTKDTGDKAVFKMQCTETGGGRPLTLIMYYAFNKKNGGWELYSEPQ